MGHAGFISSVVSRAIVAHTFRSTVASSVKERRGKQLGLGQPKGRHEHGKEMDPRTQVWVTMSLLSCFPQWPYSVQKRAPYKTQGNLAQVWNLGKEWFDNLASP